MEEFYKNVFKKDIESDIDKEEITQFKRRCIMHFNFKQDTIICKQYDSKLRDYGDEFEFPNVITAEFKMKHMTQEEQLDSIVKMFGIADNSIKKIVKKIHKSSDDDDNPWKDQ